MKSKQVIIIRKDLKCRRGKECSQSAHASLKVFIDNKIDLGNINKYLLSNPALCDWLQNLFTKICLVVNSEQELLDVYNKAKETKLLCSLIQDAGITEFNGVPTYTCCAIGPNWDTEIDPITGHLKPY